MGKLTKKIGWLIAAAVLILPVVVKHLVPTERRSFQYARLGDVPFEEVSFTNAAQNLRLAGLLYVPSGSGPFPGAVIIHGSGYSRRDNGWYLTLAHELQSNGIAVLLPDKRGSEQSEGNWRQASFQDLATDTVAGIAFLGSQESVSQVGVIGMSQGGHIAPIVASLVPDLAFVVNVVGAAVPMHELLYYEEVHNLREFGILPGVSDALAYVTAWMIREVSASEFWAAIGNFDPLPYWERVSVPTLVLYGEHDTNVPTVSSARLLRSLDNPNIQVRVYADSGHALESPPGAGDSIIRTDALRDIRDFILAATN